MSKFKLEYGSDLENALGGKEYHRRVDREYMEARFGPEDPTHINLMRFRNRKRFKKQSVAEMMEVTARTYFDYENGTRAIPSDALVRLASRTGADLHEIIMGKPAATNAEVITAGLADMKIVERRLLKSHPELDENDRRNIARRVVTTDWGELDRMHPVSIQRAVEQVTQYRDKPMNVPAPPYFRDYKDEPEQYEKAMNEWQSIMDDNFGPAPKA